MKLLYFHGGPGFNSNPEKSLLLPRFSKSGLELKLWCEPSALRKTGPIFKAENAFQNYLDCAEDFLLESFDGNPVILIGHSFGSHAVSYLVNRHPKKVKSVVFIASGLSLRHADVDMFKFTVEDYRDQGDDRAQVLQEVLQGYTGKFDGNTERGFRILAENPRLFDYYWFNKDRMNAFLSHYSGEEFGFDYEGFFHVRRSFFEQEWIKSTIPAMAVFGKHEVVVTKDAELAILRRRFGTFSEFEFQGSAHYPHIEEMERFLSVLENQILLGGSTERWNTASRPKYGGTKEIQAGSDRICYEDIGTGEPVVFLHGNSGSRKMFKPQLSGRLADRYRLIALDLPGHGESNPAKRPQEAYSLKGIARTTANFVEALGLYNPVLVAFSLGGIAVMEHLRFFSRIRAVAIIGAPLLASLEDVSSAYHAGEHIPLLFKETLIGRETDTLASAIYHSSPNPPSFAVEDVRVTDGKSRAILGESVAENPIFKMASNAHSIPVPMVSFLGEEDGLVSRDYTRRFTDAKFWRGQVQVVPNAGHAVSWDNPEFFDALLHEFITESSLIT